MNRNNCDCVITVLKFYCIMIRFGSDHVVTNLGNSWDAACIPIGLLHTVYSHIDDVFTYSTQSFFMSASMASWYSLYWSVVMAPRSMSECHLSI